METTASTTVTVRRGERVAQPGRKTAGWGMALGAAGIAVRLVRGTEHGWGVYAGIAAGALVVIAFAWLWPAIAVAITYAEITPTSVTMSHRLGSWFSSTFMSLDVASARVVRPIPGWTTGDSVAIELLNGSGEVVRNFSTAVWGEQAQQQIAEVFGLDLARPMTVRRPSRQPRVVGDLLLPWTFALVAALSAAATGVAIGRAVDARSSVAPVQVDLSLSEAALAPDPVLTGAKACEQLGYADGMQQNMLNGPVRPTSRRLPSSFPALSDAVALRCAGGDQRGPTLIDVLPSAAARTYLAELERAGWQRQDEALGSVALIGPDGSSVITQTFRTVTALSFNLA